MSWDKRLKQLESIIDSKVTENRKNYNVLEQLPEFVKTCTSIQLRAVLECALSAPELANVPDNPKLTFTTIYEIIEYNMVNILFAHGKQYYKEIVDGEFHR